jgi:hypothetical protein
MRAPSCLTLVENVGMGDHEWQGLALAAFGAVWIALTPRMHRDPIANDRGWQGIIASESRFGPRFGRSAYRSFVAFRPWIGPLAVLFGCALFFTAPPGFTPTLGGALWLVAGSGLTAAVAAALSVFLTGGPNLLLPATLRGQPGFLGDHGNAPPRNVGHTVTVHDVRPGPQDSYPPYFLAICTCGWVGESVDKATSAFEDAWGHDPNVEAEVFRPVG